MLELVSRLPKELVVMLAAMLPVTELRGAIPLGITVFRLPPWQAGLWAALGNFLPVYPILLLLGPLWEWSSRYFPGLHTFLDKVSTRARSRHAARIEKYGALALVVFVAVPSPGTGAWTGTLLAFLLAMPRRYAVPAIAVGIGAAAVLVTLATTGALRLVGIIANPLVSLAMLAVFGLLLALLLRRSAKNKTNGGD